MHKKVISKTGLTNMRKGEKRAYFRHIFANYFFCVHFSKLFLGIRNQHEILRFLIPLLNFLITNFFALISTGTFCKLWLQMRRKRLKKWKIFFLWMCLRILLGNHQRVCITKLLKSLYPIAQLSELSWRQYNWRISSAYPLSRILLKNPLPD
jgi:hypothetical protein